MAFALIGSAAAASADTHSVTTAGFDSSGADLLIAVVADYTIVTLSTVSDSKSNTWAPLTSRSVAGDGRCTIFYAKNATVGAGHTATATETSGTSYPSIAFYAFSGSNLTAPFDAENGGSGSGSTQAVGSVTPAGDNELFVAGAAQEPFDTSSIDSSFTGLIHTSYSGNHYGVGAAYKIQTTGGAENPTFTFTGSVAAAVAIATFKTAAGGGGGVPDEWLSPQIREKSRRYFQVGY